jgi:hypothetical protein
MAGMVDDRFDGALARLETACRARRARTVWRGSWDGRFARIDCSVHGGRLFLGFVGSAQLMRPGSVFDLREAVDAVAGMVLSEFESGGRR